MFVCDGDRDDEHNTGEICSRRKGKIEECLGGQFMSCSGSAPPPSAPFSLLSYFTYLFNIIKLFCLFLYTVVILYMRNMSHWPGGVVGLLCRQEGGRMNVKKSNKRKRNS